MPTYIYKAMTDKGVLVRNKVESASRLELIKSLKSNNLLPISIEQVAYIGNTANKKQKKNITDIQEIMKNVNTTISLCVIFSVFAKYKFIFSVVVNVFGFPPI